MASPATPSAPITERRYIVLCILVTSLFFLGTLGVNLNDILIPHLKKAFRLTSPGFQVGQVFKSYRIAGRSSRVWKVPGF